jgi:hypothetical protein
MIDILESGDVIHDMTLIIVMMIIMMGMMMMLMKVLKMMMMVMKIRVMMMVIMMKVSVLATEQLDYDTELTSPSSLHGDALIQQQVDDHL